MRFSQRIGKAPIKSVIQLEGMDDALRTSLWNVIYAGMLANVNIVLETDKAPALVSYERRIWAEFLKKPLDHMPSNDRFVAEIRHLYFKAHWHQVYDLIEYLVNLTIEDHRLAFLQSTFNDILALELSGYRFVDGQLTPITDEISLEAVEKAIDNTDVSGVEVHLTTALSLLSDRKKPDYRNSIKESISAVEAMVNHKATGRKGTLSALLKEMEVAKKLHPALAKGFVSIYGYAGDGDGIRHAIMDESNLTADDAIYFLVSCSAFINYLKAKI